MWSKNLYLLGYMGSGKSYLGKRLAAQFGTPFIDLDARIEAQAGQTIAALFEQYGEAHFRDLETAALRATAQEPPSIVALGGGAPVYHDNMTWLLEHGITLFLDPPIDTLIRRLSTEMAHRPLLAGESLEALRDRIATMLAQRRPTYERAHYHIQADGDQEAAILHALAQ